jgi:hypothetical protein
LVNLPPVFLASPLRGATIVVLSLVYTKSVRFWFRDHDCFGGKVFVAQFFPLLAVSTRIVGTILSHVRKVRNLRPSAETRHSKVLFFDPQFINLITQLLHKKLLIFSATWICSLETYLAEGLIKDATEFGTCL